MQNRPFKNGDKVRTRNGYHGFYIGQDPIDENIHWIHLHGKSSATQIFGANLFHEDENPLSHVASSRLMTELARRGEPIHYRIGSVKVEAFPIDPEDG